MAERLNSAEELASFLDKVEPQSVLEVTKNSISIAIDESENPSLTLHKTVPSTWYIPAEGPTEEIWVGSHQRLTKIWMDLLSDKVLNNRV